MKALVIVSDDFGFSDGVNKGAVEAYQKGILQELSFMVDAPGSESGAKLLKENDIKDVGIHLTLNDLVGTGIYLRTPDYENLLETESAEKIKQRIVTEFKKFEDLFGHIPTHVNSHHSVHQHPKVVDIVAEYAGKHKLYVRKATNFSDNRSMPLEMPEVVDNKFVTAGAKITDYIFEHILGSYEDAYKGFLTDLRTVKNDNTVTEIFFHPAYTDEIMMKYTSLLDERERDKELLMDAGFKEGIEELGFTITNFSSLK